MSGLPRPSILIDVTAVPADRKGVGRYVDELVKAIEVPVSIVCQEHDALYYGTLAPNATILPQPHIRRSWARLIWEQLVLPRVIRRAGAEVVHSPHYTLPILTRRARVVTFHDATFFSAPEVHTPLKRIFFRFWIHLSSLLADAIIVPSRATASELAHYTRRRASDFKVAHHGVDPEQFHVPSSAELVRVRSRLGLDKAPWIAFLGTIEPRKNIPTLVRAYGNLVASWKPAWGEVPSLAIAGGAGWNTELDDHIAAVPSPGEVAVMGYIELGDVSAFLGGSQLVVYPSLGEGFGLPVLEAMSCGAAVLTTPRLALPEVGGDAVAYTEPDAAAILDAMMKLLADPGERARLSASGPVRASGFTWSASAATHLSVLEAAAAKRR